MANEGNYNLGISFSKGGAKDQLASGGVNFNVAGSRMIHSVQNIGTAAEPVSVAEISPIGLVVAHNMDTTNYVELSPDGTNKLIKMLAGEWTIFRLSGTTLQAQANTAACNVEFFIIEV